MSDYLDHWTQSRSGHCEHGLNSCVQVDGSWFEILLASERQETTGYRRTTQRCIARSLNALHCGLIVFDLALEKVEISDNHREEIVEVVGDATRKLANRLHFLRLAELFFQPTTLRDVTKCPDPTVIIVKCLVSHRVGVTFKDRAVDELKLIAAYFLRMGIEVVHLLDELVGIFHQPHYEFKLRAVVPVVVDRRWNL